MSNVVESVRDRLGAMVFARVAGEEGPQRRERIHNESGVRRFTHTDPIQIVHSDASMFIGGIRALLLQSLHPLAMAAVDQHSGFRGDPWGRLQRTSTFLAETTFGTEEMAQRAVDIVHAVHQRVVGIAPDGRPYEANDPHLLLWVHIAEVDSFLTAFDRYGRRTLSAVERDSYVAQTAHVARMLGAETPPTTVAELAECFERFRPELEGTEAARRTVRFLLVHPPVPLALRPGYTVLSAAAVGLMPRWTRTPLRLPYLPIAERTAVRASGIAATSAIRWMMRLPTSR
ncbi:MAG: oxygenase MpaB family protein [Aeromicrobium sp.]